MRCEKSANAGNAKKANEIIRLGFYHPCQLKKFEKCEASTPSQVFTNSSHVFGFLNLH
jgi:hypothetical protein